MRVRTAAAIPTLLGTVGALGVTVASGATPWDTADLPSPDLTLDCPSAHELGEAGPLSGTLSDAATGEPIARHTVQVTRDDEFGAPVQVSDDRTANDGSFGPLSDTPVNRGEQTYEVAFAGNADYASTTAACATNVHGTGTTLTADEPTGVVAGNDIEVTGQLETASGDPLSGATLTATDTVDSQEASDLAETSTSADGSFTVTVPGITTGVHEVDISYAGDNVLEPATYQVEVAVANDTTLTTEPLGRLFAGEDIEVLGQLETASGDPLSGATITATDTVDDQAATDLAETTTDSEGRFTVTVPSPAAGQHRIDISYAGDGPNKPATHQVNVPVKHETMLTLTGPDSLPAEPGSMTFEITLTDGDGEPVTDALVELNDGDAWLRSKRTDGTGKAEYTKFNVTNEVPLRLEVSYDGDDTHWETSTDRTWQAVPRYAFTKDQGRYVAGQLASFAVTTPDHTLPTTITLKPYRRPAVSITPSSDSDETLFTRQMYRNSTLTISTEATDEYEAGSRTYNIRVAPRINQTLAGWYDQSGETYLVRVTRDPRLDAKVLPARPGRCVKAVVQKYIDGSYQTVETSPCRLLDVESTASFKLAKDPRPGAKFRMRFESPADEMNVAGHGDWTYIRFTT